MLIDLIIDSIQFRTIDPDIDIYIHYSIIPADSSEVPFMNYCLYLSVTDLVLLSHILTSLDGNRLTETISLLTVIVHMNNAAKASWVRSVRSFGMPSACHPQTYFTGI